MRRSGVNHGVTLIELIVVILLLGLLAGVVGLAMGSTPNVGSLDVTTVALLRARDSALRTGPPVTISLGIEGRAYRATAYPDGRVLTNAPVDIDALRGSSYSDDSSAQRGASDAER